jgi:uncharacterized membrane protein
MQHPYLKLFLILIKTTPLFIRLYIDRHWLKLTRANFPSNDDKQAKVVGYILREKNINITDQRLLNIYKILPNHISLDSKERIPALLNQWNIITTAKDLSNTDEPIDFSKAEVEKKLTLDDINKLQTPCLIRLKNGQAAALIESIDGLGEHKKSVFIYHSDRGLQILSSEEFIDIWSGVIFDMDSKNSFKEPKFFDKKVAEQWIYWRRPLSILLTVLFIIAMIHFQATHYSGVGLLIYLGVTVCLISGLAISLVLSQHSMGNSSSTLAKYCSDNSNKNAKFSCSDVLDSSAAKFLGLSQADIGVGYFAGSLLLFFISLLTVDAYPYIYSLNSIIVYLSFFAIIYSGYSIYLQKYRLKKWCLLCLYTQGIVIVQALLVLIFLSFSHHTTQNHFSILLTLTLLFSPAIIWHFLRAQLVGKKIQLEQQQQIESIISSESNIQQILQSQGFRLSSNADLETNQHNVGNGFFVELDEDLEGDLIISSNNSPEKISHSLRVVLGLSPSCLHCGSMLEELYQFIKNNNSAIECRVRLIVSEGESSEVIDDRVVAEHIAAFITKQNEGSPVALTALRFWYQDCKATDLKKWLANVRNIDEDESIDVSVLLADTSFWVNQKNINVIPAMYIENIHMPFISEEYSTILLRKITLK